MGRLAGFKDYVDVWHERSVSAPDCTSHTPWTFAPRVAV